MPLTLSPETEAAIAEQVREQHFASDDELVSLAVGVIRGMPSEKVAKLLALRRDIDEALKAEAEGRVREVSPEDMIKRAKHVYSQRQMTV